MQMTRAAYVGLCRAAQGKRCRHAHAKVASHHIGCGTCMRAAGLAESWAAYSGSVGYRASGAGEEISLSHGDTITCSTVSVSACRSGSECSFGAGGYQAFRFCTMSR